MTNFEQHEPDPLPWHKKISSKLDQLMARESGLFHPVHMVAAALGVVMLVSVAVERVSPPEKNQHQKSAAVFLGFLDCLQEQLPPHDADLVVWTLLDPSLALPPASQQALDECRQAHPLAYKN